MPIPVDLGLGLQVVFGENGVLEGISNDVGYVDMSTVDEETSVKIGNAIALKGGRFVEVCILGPFRIPPAYYSRSKRENLSHNLRC